MDLRGRILGVAMSETPKPKQSHYVRLSFELDAARQRFDREKTFEASRDLDAAAKALLAEMGLLRWI